MHLSKRSSCATAVFTHRLFVTQTFICGGLSVLSLQPGLIASVFWGDFFRLSRVANTLPRVFPPRSMLIVSLFAPSSQVFVMNPSVWARCVQEHACSHRHACATGMSLRLGVADSADVRFRCQISPR